MPEEEREVSAETRTLDPLVASGAGRPSGWRRPRLSRRGRMSDRDDCYPPDYTVLHYRLDIGAAAPEAAATRRQRAEFLSQPPDAELARQSNVRENRARTQAAPNHGSVS